jgi:KDO2-lipid IV(A) lauroyltransferase
LIKGLLHLFARLPLPITHAIATGLGRFIAHYPKWHIVQVTRTNIHLCFPELPPVAQTDLVKQNLVETCKTFSELGALWLWPSTKTLNLVRMISGETYLQHAFQQGRGVILLTPHLGAWEMAGLYASSRYPMTALYRPPKLSGLQTLIHTARERAGGRFMPTDQAGVRALYQTLKRGHVVGILPDQVPSEAGSGVFAPFFGLSAYTIVLVSRLAYKTGAPVILTYAARLTKGQGFHLHFLPTTEEIGGKEIVAAVSALNQVVEQCIRCCPAQYQWSYKRFKAQPEGEISIY